VTTIQVKTYLAGNFWHSNTCAFCERRASYISQKVDTDGTAHGVAIWHCQKHRTEGRLTAEQSTREDLLKDRPVLLEKEGWW